MKKWLHGALLLSLLGMALYAAVTFHSNVHETCNSEWTFTEDGGMNDHFTKLRLQQ